MNQHINQSTRPFVHPSCIVRPLTPIPRKSRYLSI